MKRTKLWCTLLCLITSGQVLAQVSLDPKQSQVPSGWRRTSNVAATNPTGQTAPASSSTRTTLVASKGRGELPRGDGQIWREYDIKPYTSKVKTTAKPEQAIIDWILRETGTEVWFTEPVGLLNATRDTLYVYHTKEMHDIVSGVLKRFVESDTEPQAVGLRLVTIDSPNWRSLAYPLLRPVNVQSPGLEAWILSKENAAVLMTQLQRRSDYREHSAPNLLMHNGQSQTLAKKTPRNYIRSAATPGTARTGQPLGTGTIEEGYSLQISPLFSPDGRTIDAVVKCSIDQVEKLIPISVDMPTYAGQTQRIQVQVPQMVSWRMHERFRWPKDKILLLSCGVVAKPEQSVGDPLGLTDLFGGDSARADALLFIEAKGPASQALIQVPTAAAPAPFPFR